ncbi:hypothetical protein PG984_013489 [Apiospora sp. TS-2023a]
MPWSLNFSAFMVLLNETHEIQYRLSYRSIQEVIVAAPVTGFQSYLSGHEILYDPIPFEYTSPFGCKTATLRNWTL